MRKEEGGRRAGAGGGRTKKSLDGTLDGPPPRCQSKRSRFFPPARRTEIIKLSKTEMSFCANTLSPCHMPPSSVNDVNRGRQGEINVVTVQLNFDPLLRNIMKSALSTANLVS